MSGVSSTISEVFRHVNHEDTFSVDTPQSYGAGNDNIDLSSSEASDTDTGASSESGSPRGRGDDGDDADWLGKFRDYVGPDSRFDFLDDFEVFAQLLLKDLEILCGTPQTNKREQRHRSNPLNERKRRRRRKSSRVETQQ
jgi:hypothetical protein